MASSDDSTLIKVAVFGFAMSIFCTAGLTLLLSDTANSDYSFDEINEYRSTLSSFTGESMLSETPWILTGIYTAWEKSDGVDSSHLDPDGWLYGEQITPVSDYYGVQSSAAIFKMDPDKKSSRLLTTGESYDFSEASGVQWWATNDFTRALGEALGQDPYTYTTYTGNTWDYTGYRFVLDATLPFDSSQTATSDGSLSLVWYSYNGSEGLSGGLDIYGGKVLLASYAATDIISGYNSASGYSTSYQFDFEGTILNLNIRFDQTALENGMTLMEAWTTGLWEIAVTSTGAGLFLDVENSNSYSVTMGSMISTFTQIYTFQMPEIDNGLISILLWIMVGLPMTISLALIVLRVTDVVKPF